MSRLETIAQGITNNFNTLLKSAFKFNELYGHKINDDMIYLLPTLKKGKSLIDMLRSTPGLSEGIRLGLKRGLHEKYQDIIDVKMNIINYSIVIELITSPFEMGDIPDIGIKVNIASNLSLKELKSLCVTNNEFIQLCKSNDFWAQLFQYMYPGYNFNYLRNLFKMDNINFENLYKGLLYYEENLKYRQSQEEINRLMRDDWSAASIRMLSDYPDSFIFLLSIGKITKEIIIEKLDFMLHLAFIKLINAIYEKYSDIFDEEQLYIFLGNIIYEHSIIIDALNKYLWIKDKLGEEVTINDLLNELNSDAFEFSKEIIDYLPEDIDINLIIEKMIYIIDNDSDHFIVKLLFIKYRNKLNEEQTKNLLYEVLK